MAIAYIDADRLANVALYLWYNDPEIYPDNYISRLLEEWSKGNTRAFNEQYRESLAPVTRRMIWNAYKAPTFRYNRGQAKATLRLMDYNTLTSQGGPETFKEFDALSYFRAFASIMDLAFKRALEEMGTED